LVTRKKFADENPDTVRGVVTALNQGTGWATRGADMGAR
jgi:ABC-type nitrate/sulfonate/bicarbonate transport system substrate-binding protein